MHVRNIYNQILLKTFLSSPNLRKNTGLVFLTLLYNIHSHKNRKLLSISCDYMQYTISSITRGGSRTAETSKMERFLIMVNGWKPLNFITKRSILDVAAALDPPLVTLFERGWEDYIMRRLPDLVLPFRFNLVIDDSLISFSFISPTLPLKYFP